MDENENNWFGEKLSCLCSCCFNGFELDPMEYRLSQKAIDEIVKNELYTENDDSKKQEREFNITIESNGNKNISFDLVKDTDGKYFPIFDEKEKGDEYLNSIFQRLINGKSITIDTSHAETIQALASKLKIKDLENLCNPYILMKMDRGFLATILNIIFMIRSFLRHIGTISKFFITLWDLIGVAFVCGCLSNIIIYLSTTGLSTAVTHGLMFTFIMIPTIIFSLFFVNIMIISFLEFFKFRPFIDKSPLTSVQVLFVKLLKNFGCKCGCGCESKDEDEHECKCKRVNLEKKEYFDFGWVYDIFMGILLIVFLACFALQAVTTKASAYIESLIYIFVIIIPPVKYLAILILYVLHCGASCSKKCTDNFIETGDFSDYILNAIYFREHPYRKFFKNLCRKSDKIDKSQNQVIELENQPDEKNVKSGETKDAAQFNTSDSKTKSCCKTFWRFIWDVILTRYTFGIYVIFCFIVYVIFSWRTAKVTPLQIISLFVVVLGILFPLSVCICFPFFWIGRQKETMITEGDIEKKRQINLEALENNDQKEPAENEKKKKSKISIYVEYNNDRMLWSHSAVVLRWSSICLTTMVVFYLLLASLAALVISFNPNVLRNDNIEYEKANKGILSDPSDIDKKKGFKKPRNPICDYSLKGLTSLQLISLADASYYDTPERKEKRERMFKEYFPANFIEDIDTKVFPDPIYNCSLSHFQIDSLKLIVFSIKGTKSLNDVLADAELWIGSMIFDLFMQFMPLVDLYLTTGRSTLAMYMSIPRYIFKQFSLVEKYVNKYMNYIESVTIPEDYDVIITGHSLGGGIAKIISRITGWQAVVVSGPGINSVEYIYPEKVKNIGNTFVNINPGQDVIASIDSISDSSEFKIPCSAGVMKCHLSVRTLCQTGVICGYAREHEEFCRAWFQGKEYDEMMDVVYNITEKASE